MPSSAAAAPRSSLTWTTSLGITTTIQLDAVRDINDARTSTLTQHAVEDGSVISDHLIQNPNVLTLTILCTNTPTQNANQGTTNLTLPVRASQFKPRGLLALTRGVGAAVAAAVGSLLGGKLPGSGNSIQVNVLSAPSTSQRVAELHEQLIDLQVNATPIEVRVGGMVYTNQILTSVQKSTGPGQYGLGVFNCTFQELVTVAATRVEQKAAADLIARAKALKAAKAKAARDAAAKTKSTTKLTSLAAQGLDVVGGG